MERPIKYFLEIACFDIDSALIAQEGGADRIEFCAGRDVGGTTPGVEKYIELRKRIGFSIPINVMVRPRGGNFVYNQAEFEEMKRDINRFERVLGPNDGFVCGVLAKDNRVDLIRCKELLQCSSSNSDSSAISTTVCDGDEKGYLRRRHFTFHRAFDEIAGLNEMVDDQRTLYELGFKAILTSGGPGKAIDRVPRLFELQNQPATADIIVGGGVRSSNLEILKRGTCARWYHSSAITDTGETADLGEVRAMKSILSDPTIDV